MLKMREPVLRLVALTAIFVITTRVAVWLVNRTSTTLAAREANLGLQVGLMGLTGFVAMAGSVLLGVYLGAVVGIGAEARSQRSFIWWVINRLLFLAAITSVQGFAQYYLADYLNIANAVSMTTVLMGVVGLFLVISALGGGYLADRFGRKPLVILAGITAGVGTFMLLSAREIPIAALQGVPMVMIGGCVIGLGTGTFMATHWALGTDLVPPEDAGRYLGISNLAGAGAGIVGAGIGGPMADYFNSLQTGLGYLVIFAIYAVLFLLSSLVLTRVKAR
jgi:MFS family permease